MPNEPALSTFRPVQSVCKPLIRLSAYNKDRFAKPLYGLTPVSRVRIPPSPPDIQPGGGDPPKPSHPSSACCPRPASQQANPDSPIVYFRLGYPPDQSHRRTRETAPAERASCGLMFRTEV